MDLRALRLALPCAISAVAACAPPVPAPGRADAPIVDALGPSTDAAVVAIVTWERSCEVAPRPVCSGVLVAPRVVLTAAHCVDDVLRAQAAAFFGPRVGGAGTYLPIVGGIAHPDYDPDVRRFDVGMLVLAAPSEETPIALPSASADELALGATLRVVGYGVTAGDDAAHATAGERREGTMALESIGASELLATPAPSTTCRIDSGGPVLADVGGTEVLVGITAGGDETCTERARSVRVDVVLAAFVAPFLESVAATAPRPPADDARLMGLCDAECSGDDACPLSMSCGGTPSGPRCATPGAVPGAYGIECGGDRECGGAPCVRLEPAGPAQCRCFTACDGIGPMLPPIDAGADGGGDAGSGGGGCAVGARGARAGTVWIALGWLLAAALRRTRGRTP